MKISNYRGIVIVSFFIGSFVIPTHSFAASCHFISVTDDFLDQPPTAPKGQKLCVCNGDEMTDNDGGHMQATFWASVPSSANCSSCSFFNPNLWDRPPITLSCNDQSTLRKRFMKAPLKEKR